MANLYARLVYPILRRLDAESVHNGTIRLLEIAQQGPTRPFLKLIAGQLPNRPVEVAGLTFPNLLGVAAGFDKDARVAAGLGLLGFGHVEVGTLTPKPQAGKPRPRIFRLEQDGALINRMGFPNGGASAALPRLRKLAASPRSFILGVSLGKQKETPLTEAADDYLAVMKMVYDYADYLAVNISSPNTPGLRELQGQDYLGRLLQRLMAESRALAKARDVARRPIFVKIAPDLNRAELRQILTAVQDNQIDGMIATNTTTSRGGLASPRQKEAGGLSGRPLARQSNDIIRTISSLTNGRLPIIGVGGIYSAADVHAKLAAGASLVQLYTGLVYAGPGLPGRLVRALAISPEATN